MQSPSQSGPHAPEPAANRERYEELLDCELQSLPSENPLHDADPAQILSEAPPVPERLEPELPVTSYLSHVQLPLAGQHSVMMPCQSLGVPVPSPGHVFHANSYSIVLFPL